MKYIIAIPILFFFFSCSSDTDNKQQSYLNNTATVQIGNIPFDLSSAKVVSSIIRHKDHHTILILTDKKSQTTKNNLSNGNAFVQGAKWLIIYWQQKDDLVWIGARIPGKFLYTDLIQFNNNDFIIRRYDSSGKILKLDNAEKKKISTLLLSAWQL
ncbi:MAG: hypothetical protein A2499_14465 [Stygiobacter sp. RIFOXYC12_FULL_38_8]|nr:MAG: hypothetical protein FD188_2442 [Ignavibacteria bacterium]OGU64936.1 MAG: hypothetical protein A2X62_12675 [Stygiobacter sp. GWC2_38_9]OGU84743.1 MAG: hypothetical protein A2279_13340 [Stygiobacter sp. RIFOXYA12_FULL_38_9]OGV07783.1 MAG: hypothetical protein A2299_06385 [Stygiobacter sp. RIFOXYB2_FULL_37_11]OGV11648.1 MAG: hypothetical protein A2237_17840 [Stygiobacter sp. RIFOXYA2_FULL_38_8]OGV12786.1 MAG: hypothetical protein A2440_16220 [Stygiobacter sp. RIFOXYC2_FULL_38_25]OGV2704